MSKDSNKENKNPNVLGQVYKKLDKLNNQSLGILKNALNTSANVVKKTNNLIQDVSG